MAIRHYQEGFNWEDVPVLAYTEEGARFKSITRRVLFEGSEQLPSELRYFEIAVGGHSTLERHNHVHNVFILRGSGAALIGSEIASLSPFDLVAIPPLTWHQFRATKSGPFGFLCMVNSQRDRPQRPGLTDLAVLKADPRIASFIIS